MSELGGININVVGLPPNQHEKMRSLHYTNASEKKSRQLSELRPAPLTPEHLGRAREVEKESQRYFRTKMVRLGLPADSLMDLPEVHYTIPQGKEGEGGEYTPLTNIAEVFVPRKGYDFFDKLGHVPHELSHASVSRETEYYFPDGISGNLSSTYADGLMFIEDHKALGSGIEEGLVIFDQVDFFHTHLREILPEDYEKRRKFTESAYTGEKNLLGTKGLRKQIEAIDQSLYGAFTSDNILPFVALGAPNIPILRKSLIPEISRPTMLREYLFARKLCELVGRNANPEVTDQYESVAIGRDILDRDRYLRTGQARGAIVEALGEERAAKIFQLGAHDIDKIDDAMRILVAS